MTKSQTDIQKIQAFDNWLRNTVQSIHYRNEEEVLAAYEKIKNETEFRKPVQKSKNYYNGLNDIENSFRCLSLGCKEKVERHPFNFDTGFC